MKEISIEKAHNHLKSIAIAFDKICKENNIQYWMLGGTMLGAVRHKGFIPWDDDMDFGVLRRDFGRLKDILKKELPDQYRVLTNRDMDTIISDVIKIEDTNTIVTEIELEGIESNKGLNIDIFPLDKTNSNFTVLSRNQLIHFLSRIQSYRYTPTVPFKWKQKFFWMLSYIFFPFVSKNFSTKLINSLAVRNKGTHMANHYGAWGIREIVREDVFYPITSYQFEDVRLNGVSDFDTYLSTLYGDYMRLPPENKRHIHLGKFYEL